VGFLSRFLCAGLALNLLVNGCAGPRPLKGGKAVITRRPTGIVEQTVVQGENASQPSKQDQETIKVRMYTLPAASRIEQCQGWEGECPREPKRGTMEIRAREDARPPGRGGSRRGFSEGATQRFWPWTCRVETYTGPHYASER
jgi:hypothetical protein